MLPPVGFDLSLVDATLVVALAGAAFSLAKQLTMLHSPHDVISDVAVATGRSGRKHVFVVSRHNLLGSVDSDEWKRLTCGLGPYKISAIAVSPAFERDRTLFVAAFGGGVFRSRNGGRSWAACTTGLRQRYIVRLCVARDFETSGVILALGLDGAVYASSSEGDGWRLAFDTVGKQARDGFAETTADATEVLSDPMRDSGEAWKSCRPSRGVTALAAAADGFLAGTSDGSLFVSRHGGVTWALFARVPDGARITCLEVPAGESSRDQVFAGTEGAGLFSVSVDGRRVERRGHIRALEHVTALASRRRADGRLELFACAWRSALFVSHDEGATWKRSAQGLTTHRQADERRYGAPHFGAVAIEHAGDELYVGGFDGLFRATGSTGAWEPVETLSPGIVIDLAVSPAHGNGFAVAASSYGGGLALRADPIEPWSTANTGAPTTRLGPVRFSPTYASDGTLFVGSEGCVLASRDHGHKWLPSELKPIAGRDRGVRLFAAFRAVERSASRYLSTRSMKLMKATFQTVALHTGGRVSRFVFPTVIAVSPDYGRNRTLFVGTRAHGVFRSRDGGRSFEQLWDADNRFVHSLVVSAELSEGETLFATNSDGLYASADGGATWKRKRHGKAFARALLAISPDFRHDGTLFVAGHDGLYCSSDGGATWQPRTVTQSGECVVGGIALSPEFATDRTMLVHVRGHGLFRSTDGGRTFAPLPWDRDDHDHAFCPLSCFPDSTTLFQFSPRFAVDRTVIAARLDQVLVSRDAGVTWAELTRVMRYENSRPEIHYSGRWALDVNDAHSGHQAHLSTRRAATATLKFFGTRVSWLGSRGPDHGMADVRIDGQVSARVDLYSPRPERACELYETSLPRGWHSIAIEVRHERNARSRGRAVTVDAFDVQVDAGSRGAKGDSAASV